MVGAAVERPGGERRVQPLTATFRLGNVDVTATPPGELHRLMRAAAESGDFALPRTEGSAHRTVLPGVVHTNMTRVNGVNPLDPWELSAAERLGRRQVHEYTRFLRSRVPGYADSYLLGVSTRIGVRESRRLVGRYVLTRDDVLSARRFDDDVAQCGAPIEDHAGGSSTIWQYVGGDGDPTGMTYGVPYRSSCRRRCRACSSPAVACRRRTTRTPRSDRWRSAWPWDRRRGRRRPSRSPREGRRRRSTWPNSAPR